MENRIVKCQDLNISNSNKICLIAGPCQLETEQHALDMAGEIKNITDKYDIGFIYKTSFDKANRTSLKSKRGAGLEKSVLLRVPVNLSQSNMQWIWLGK